MNQADTAWMLVATALVLLMTPALAFFYGGLVRSKNALNTMMMSFISLGFVSVLWAVIGYSLAFAPGNNWIGDTSRMFLNGVGLAEQGTIPHYLFMCFQGTFAIITAALISGAIVERMRFSAYVVFITLWALLVYSPLCHWVWGGGWLADMGALDFAGGTVVHVNAGAAALVAALVVGKRKDYPGSGLLPHNVPFTLLGAGLLWFGWFGFNAGSALAANGIAALAFTTTMLAPAGTLVVWTILDLIRQQKSTAVGAATAIVVGLVAITPAAGFVGPMSAIALGAIAAVPSYFALIDPRQEQPRRLARRRRGARRWRDGRRHPDRRLRAEGPQRPRRRVAVRESRAGLDSGCRRRRGDRLQRRHELRAAEADRTGAAAARRRHRRDRRPRRHAARRGGLHPRARHDSDIGRFPSDGRGVVCRLSGEGFLIGGTLNCLSVPAIPGFGRTRGH